MYMIKIKKLNHVIIIHSLFRHQYFQSTYFFFLIGFSKQSRLCFLNFFFTNIYNWIQFLQVGVVVWPVLQVFNYTMVPEKNRIPFVSLCSLAWSSFLAYMNHCNKNKENTLVAN